MEPDEMLDICGIVQPYCFLLCKSTLASMKPGGLLDVYVRDPQTLGDLTMILERSGETILSSERQGDRFRLQVRKGGR